MSQPHRPTPLWVVGAVVGAFAAVIFLGPQTAGPALTLGGGAIAWVLWRRWRDMKSERSVLAGLQAHWAMLPGASWTGDTVALHHGDQPIAVHLSRTGGHMRARVATPIGEQPMAFRVWHAGGSSPAISPDGSHNSGPEMRRSALVTSWLAGRFEAESNDEDRLVSLIGQEVLAALFSLGDTLGEDFEGIAYDGQRLTVLLSGPVVADPERASQLARVVWRAFVP